MVKYKINFKFKENGSSLNEVIVNVLKIKLDKNINMTSNILKTKQLSNHTHYSQNERGNN